jgi:SAM-dependent methyltransferase
MNELITKTTLHSSPRRPTSDSRSKDWYDEIFKIYDKMRAPIGPYELPVGDRVFTILPNVYAPNFFTDSFWFAEQCQSIIGTKSLLEVGTGTGLIGITCALRGAQVVATDVNPDAVRNATLNAARNGALVSIRLGDVYQPIAAGERFDFIFWAHPFNNSNEPGSDMLFRSGFDYQYRALRKYIAFARRHLSSSGRLLLGTGDSADLGTIHEIAHDHDYCIDVVREARLPLEFSGSTEITYLVYEFVPM